MKNTDSLEFLPPLFFPVSERKEAVCMFSHVWYFATPWTVACQAPLSMGFSRQEYCSGLPCLPPGDLPNPGIEPKSWEAKTSTVEVYFLTTSLETKYIQIRFNICPLSRYTVNMHERKQRADISGVLSDINPAVPLSFGWCVCISFIFYFQLAYSCIWSKICVDSIELGYVFNLLSRSSSFNLSIKLFVVIVA